MLLTYTIWVSALDRMERMKEAVWLGLKVDGTMRYSPGFRWNNSVASREFMYVLLMARGLWVLKKEEGNFPFFPLSWKYEYM